jgi:capsular polysaccharide biosynthesis protein
LAQRQLSCQPHPVAGRIGWRYLAMSAAWQRLTETRARAQEISAALVPGVRAFDLSGPGVTYTETAAPREVQLTIPSDLDQADRAAMRQRNVGEVPGQFVLELPGATLRGREGWVFHEGRLVEDIWQEAGFSARSMLPRSVASPPRHLPGTSVSLLMPWTPNYYHWTVQAVPRILAVRDALGGDLGQVDHWLVSGNPPPYVDEWLDAVGVPRGRRVDVVEDDSCLTTDRLLVASVPGRNRWVGADDVAAIRAAAPTAPPGRGGGASRLLIRRNQPKRRVALNGDAVVAALRPRGFEVVDPATMTVAEEVAAFGAADVVVGVHGAGLTNMVFCRPGTLVVELTPRGLVYPTFVKLAAAAGVEHHVLVGREPRLPRGLRFPDTSADLLVDVERLESLVDEYDRSALVGGHVSAGSPSRHPRPSGS